jgi:hypothetical protein
VGVVYDHMCQQQCDQRIGYAAGLRPGNMSQIGARSAYLALRDFDPANVSCGSKTEVAALPSYVCVTPQSRHRRPRLQRPFRAMSRHRSKQRYLSGSLAAVGEAAVAIECETEMRS